MGKPDFLVPGRGNDTLAGDSGDDGLHGDNYTDTGDPVVDSGDGSDRCSGGAGTDSAARCERCRHPLTRSNPDAQTRSRSSLTTAMYRPI